MAILGALAIGLSVRTAAVALVTLGACTPAQRAAVAADAVKAAPYIQGGCVIGDAIDAQAFSALCPTLEAADKGAQALAQVGITARPIETVTLARADGGTVTAVRLRCERSPAPRDAGGG